MNTLLLDVKTWDLLKDASGNIALAQAPYAIGQDVASASRLFSGELWYDTTQGIMFFSLFLGKSPPIALLKAAFVTAARKVPGVKSARCVIASFTNRTVQGQIQITDDTGATQIIAIRQVIPEF